MKGEKYRLVTAEGKGEVHISDRRCFFKLPGHREVLSDSCSQVYCCSQTVNRDEIQKEEEG